MIDKQPWLSGTVRVSFREPAAYDAVAVRGDFNDWDPRQTLLHTECDCRVASETLRPGRRYLFRDVTRTGTECNDEAADDDQVVLAGGSRGVLDLTGVGAMASRVEGPTA